MSDPDDDADDLHGLLARSVQRLREARGDAACLRDAIERYLEEGDALELSPYVLRDYFAISTPGLPEQAGYTEAEQQRAEELFAVVTESRYGSQ